jgi:signal transduction histidine kinase
MEELLLQLVESLRRSMRVAAAEIWTGTSGRLERAVSVPHRPPATLSIGETEAPVVVRAGATGGKWLDLWLPELVAGRDSSRLRIAPIAHAGELLGLIVLERAPTADPATPEQDSIVVELARQVGLALHNVQLDSALQASLEELQRRAEELQESRARIVTAGDAERERLERNLHDGAQQHLVALTVKTRLARDVIADDPEAAEHLLDDIRADLGEALQELRALAHGIFPPLLMAGGLGEALPAAANRNALPTRVQVDTTKRYPREIEAAIYFCCLEAMQNAAKHAGEQAAITVRVDETDTALRFEVSDDGAGFEADDSAPRGVGFVNMADRLGAFRGTLVVESSAGHGTRVEGTLPLPREEQS